jgi:O-antigen/teichoic acid export membrane protein
MQRIQQLSRQSARGAILIGLPISLVLLVFGKPIIGVVFGEDYIHMAYLPMVVLVCGYVFHLLAGSCAILLIMCGYEKLTLLCQLAGLFVMVILSLILIPSFQALGAALAVTVGVVVYTMLQALSVTKFLKIRPGIF